MKIRLLQLILKIMKLSFYGFALQLVLLNVLMAGSAIGQKNQSVKEVFIDLQLSNASIVKVFNAIESKTNYRFNYNKPELDKKLQINISSKNNSVAEVLMDISAQTGLKFRQVNQSINVDKRKGINNKGIEIILAADVEISGKITDENGESLPGTSIVVKGTATGTTSDIEGNYKLNVPEDVVLTISFVGYKTQEVSIAGRSTVDIEMELDAEQLKEVVVIGYGGVVDKKDLTGAVASADLNRALESSNVSIVQALQGAIAGLNVGAVTNAGQDPSLSIRGQSTLSSSGGDNAPLIVLDGIIYRGSIIDINSADIESIDVLKDASSAAIYGSQASNGVIVITSKSGASFSKPIFNYSSSYTMQTPSNKFEPMDAAELEEVYPDIFWEEGGRLAPDYLEVNPSYVWQNNFKTLDITEGYNNGLDTPWYDLLTNNGHISTHNLSVGGKSESLNYFMSGGFTDQAAFIKNDTYKKYNFRVNIDAKINDWLRLGTQTFIAISDYSGQDAGSEAPFLLQPWAPIHGVDGILIPKPEGSWLNPFLTLSIEDSDVRLNLSSNMFAEVKLPLEGLSYRINYANNYRTRDHRRFDPNAANFTGSAYQDNSKSRDWTLDNIISYKRTFNDVHNFNATFVYGVEERDLSSVFAGAQNFSVDLLGYNRLQAGDPSLNNVSSTKEKESSLYQMGRLLYNYSHRYYFTGTIRRDGFSGFGKNDKTAIFPTMALAWVISEESFADDISWINFLKLRASYGKSGRRGVGRYATAAVVNSGPRVVFGDGGQTFQGQSIQSLSNISLGWETTTGTNIGLDFELINTRLRGGIEYYKNKTENILFAIALPAITGFGTINDNIASVSNNGVELSLTGTVIGKGNLRWEASVNFNRVRNNIESILGADNDNDGREDDLTGNRLFIGEPQNVVYDYEVVGMWQLADKEDGSIWNGFLPGTYKLNDLNGDDGISSLEDRKILGYSDPSYRFGVANTVSYKNLSLYVFINSIQGGKNYYMGNDAPHAYGNWVQRDQLSYNNFPKGAWDYWMPENPDAKYRRLDTSSQFGGTPYNQRSFVRLQDVSLAYTFPIGIIEKINITNLKIFVSGKNLITGTKWKGSDPETGVGFNPSRPLLKSYTMGLNVQF
ncbi:SusC/RagA family TonB-linked outer membrane protein [Reichenbachiella sp. MALMAid0571]|uniref:SusC/RagA family TonB-linked outer membrane protein n=1 Tax=Reichenbachiella sp. MALMAid0571 TaxID=3143939 RepID=UPI0032DE4C20